MLDDHHYMKILDISNRLSVQTILTVQATSRLHQPMYLWVQSAVGYGKYISA
ncbi:hypothetical protein JOD20_002240 [Herpetosiphon giganteus]|nr:hypothetical protein [Herpetosiphon giganteus]